ncbi:MAG: SDR family NAD(P)-dependent oxidoreductase, partial [Oscillospiraceae bacterium]|nr:SDR family NAD(P)-dependent oxidoreductase [Oscillospiraceae bacterium]
MELPLHIDLSGKVAVITGAGGVLCSMFARAMAQSGAKVALLDLNEEAAHRVASEIAAEGHIAKAYHCDVLDKMSCEAAREQILSDLGAC